LPLLPLKDETTRKTVYDIAKFQTELAVTHTDFLPIKSSVTAYCAVMNALESCHCSDKTLERAEWILSEATGIAPDCDQVCEAQRCLYETVLRQPLQPTHKGAALGVAPTQLGRSESHEVSPRSVYCVR
jgi:hypothetical protein